MMTRCSIFGTKWIFKYYLHELRFQRVNPRSVKCNRGMPVERCGSANTGWGRVPVSDLQVPQQKQATSVFFGLHAAGFANFGRGHTQECQFASGRLTGLAPFSRRMQRGLLNAVRNCGNFLTSWVAVSFWVRVRFSGNNWNGFFFFLRRETSVNISIGTADRSLCLATHQVAPWAVGWPTRYTAASVPDAHLCDMRDSPPHPAPCGLSHFS
jgi:hypothetical protein